MITINPVALKNFYLKHKKGIVITTLAITTAGTVLMFRNQREFNKFLKEHDLMDQYYTPENSY